MRQHRISEQTLQLAQQHAKVVIQHGQQVEQRAIDLRARGEASEEQIAQIAQAGREIQTLGQASLAHAIAAQNDPERSTQEYQQAVQAHAEAVHQHVAANNVILEASKRFRSEVGETPTG